MQILKYKYRLYPNQVQLAKLNQVAGNNRFVWNHYLDKEIQQYANNKTFIFNKANSKDLTAFKKTNEWLQLSPSTSLQQTLLHLERALKDSFPNSTCRRGFPKFKKKRQFDSSFSMTMTTTDRNCNFENNTFKIPNIGWIKTKYHRALPSDFKSCTVKQKAGKWFAVLTVKLAKQPKRTTNRSIGIDLNSKEFVLNDGTRYVMPKILRENQAKIAKLQRQLSKKTKSSQSYFKAQKKLAKAFDTVTNKRSDYFHKLSKKLVDNFDIISLEDLNVAAMQQWNGKMIQDNGFGMIRQLIEYKAELYGAEVVIIDRYYPSSKTCSNCGCVQNIPLSVRVYNCGNCKTVIDRDLNAAININRAGMAQIHAGGKGTTIQNQILIGKLFAFDETGSPFLENA